MVHIIQLLKVVLEDPPLEDFIETLRTITKNNPWCSELERLMRKGEVFGLAIRKDIRLTKTLYHNLPLLIVDLNQYLISRRNRQQEHLKKDYLQKSIDVVNAGFKYRSSWMNKNMQKMLVSQPDGEAMDVARGEGCRLIKRGGLNNYAEKIKRFRLEHVAGYWVEANQMVRRLVENLELKPELQDVQLKVDRHSSETVGPSNFASNRSQDTLKQRLLEANKLSKITRPL